MRIRQRGYTLIEILVVIAIIGVLVAMLSPMLTSVRARGLMTSCTNNLKNVGTGMMAYSADEYNRGCFPAEHRDGAAADDPDNYCWFDKIDTYIGTSNLNRVKQCPAWDKYAILEEGMVYSDHTYKMNSKLQNMDDKSDPAFPADPDATPPKYYFPPAERIKNANRTILILDGRTDGGGGNATSSRAYIGLVDHSRHAGKTGIIFCDGSVKHHDGLAEGLTIDGGGWNAEGPFTWDPWS
jgi:prepilin-type N-terminal cleavage/methylation domain-containing protein/prepilin-type processing-associated H-X9-DG protein